MVTEQLGDLKGLTQLLAGGDILSPVDVQQAAQQLTGGHLINGYGPTESTTFTCCYSVPIGSSYQGRSVPIGKPIANTQVYVLDRYLQPVPIGVVGELHIGGDGLARGYLNRPELTAEKFIVNPFGRELTGRLYKSGDLARYLPDGNIEFLGRTDHQVKIRGFRIELGEIEATLGQHPGVGQCVVLTRENHAGERRLVAYIVPFDQYNAPATEQLREFLKQKLPEYMIPSAVMMLEKMPLTPNGKIDHRALPAPEFGMGSSAEGYEAPRTPIEEALAEIWRNVLDLKRVGIYDDFFALGGHSLQVTHLLAKIERLFGQRVLVPGFFLSPTIEGLSRAIEERSISRQLTPLRVGNVPGTLFFLDAGIGLCRLATLLTAGPSAVATAIPLLSSELQALAELPSLESIAAAHVALIRNSSHVGPYLLAGYSFGGVLAYEVAQQLLQEGVVVELVLLLDSWATTPSWWQKLKASLNNEPERNTLPHQLLALMRSIPKRATRLAVRSKSESDGFPSRSSGRASLLFGETAPTVLLKVLRRIRNAYEFKPLGTRAVLFRCQNDIYSTHMLNGQMGWENRFIGGLEIIETPGDHATLLKEPNLQELARRINNHLGSLRSGMPANHIRASRPMQGQVPFA